MPPDGAATNADPSMTRSPSSGGTCTNRMVACGAPDAQPGYGRNSRRPRPSPCDDQRMRATTFSGIDAIDAVTEVLRRVSETHPDGGLFHAADVQFWWARERSTDTLPQLFWVNDDGRPALNQLSLYDSDLDLVVFAPDGTPAGNAIFWFDPVTRTGVVEPVRTHDDHQRRGIARHLLTTGVDLLARAGADGAGEGGDGGQARGASSRPCALQEAAPAHGCHRVERACVAA